MGMRSKVRNWRGAVAALVLVGLAWNAPARGDDKLVLNERWVYCPSNLLVDANIDKLADIFQRAGKAGYNGVLLSDSKFSRLGQLEPKYFQNAERVKKLAKDNGLELIPEVFPTGWGNDILSVDPNLAEGLPVREALFVVQNGAARLEADPPVGLRGGDMSDLKKWDWHDPVVTLEGGAVRMDPTGGNARISQKVKLHPFRQYAITVRIKTAGFKGKPEVKVLTKDGHALDYADLGVKATQDWTVHHVVFNALDNEEVNVYFGSWEAKGGTLWWKDAKLEEVGLVNVLRRPGAPLVVKKEDGTVLAEGKDFEKVADPRLGNIPWRGDYEIYHEGPAIKTSLPDGTRLRVSYYHPMVVYGGSVAISMAEPKTFEIYRDQAQRVHALFGAKGYFMSHDEIRVGNWDEASAKLHSDAGGVLAANVRQCTKILKDINPGGRIYVWSDMFDPNHNAHKDYYLVHGDLAKSCEGLDKDVIVALWYLEKR